MMNGNGKPGAVYEVAAVRKALEILCEFGTDTSALSVSDLSRRLEMPKSTAHNLLRTLEGFDFLKQDPADRRYRLGPRVYELGLRFSHHTRLVPAALPEMRSLAEYTKETVKLGILSGREVLILAGIESPYQLHTRGDEGVRAPLHCTGLGKAILAALPVEEIGRVLDGHGLPRLTPHTITAVGRLKEELEKIRGDGYALDVEENELGVICVAAGIIDAGSGNRAAVSVSAPASRLYGERIQECAQRVAEAAQAVARALGPEARGEATRRVHEDFG